MSTEKKYEEATLLAMLAQDNEYAFQLIFDKYRNKVYRVAMLYIKSPVLAEEIVQDIFVKLWFERKSLFEKASIESWIYTLTRNHTINALKRLAFEWTQSEKWVQQIEKFDLNTPDYGLRNKEAAELLKQATDNLPEQQAKVFYLARERGLSYEAISEQLGLSPLTVKTHMARALASIRLFLRSRGVDFILILCLAPYF